LFLRKERIIVSVNVIRVSTSTVVYSSTTRRQYIPYAHHPLIIRHSVIRSSKAAELDIDIDISTVLYMEWTGDKTEISIKITNSIAVR
jgi:hypothetical protein